MRRLLFPFFIVFGFFLTAAHADEVNHRSNPVLTATEFLKSFAAKDAARMMKVGSPDWAEPLSEVVEKGEAARAYREIFRGWRHKAAESWDGNFLEMRAKTFAGGKSYTMLPYYTDTEGWIGVLMLRKNDGGWYVDDIEKWQLSDYRQEKLSDQ